MRTLSTEPKRIWMILRFGCGILLGKKWEIRTWESPGSTRPGICQKSDQDPGPRAAKCGHIISTIASQCRTQAPLLTEISCKGCLSNFEKTRCKPFGPKAKRGYGSEWGTVWHQWACGGSTTASQWQVCPMDCGAGLMRKGSLPGAPPPRRCDDLLKNICILEASWLVACVHPDALGTERPKKWGLVHGFGGSTAQHRTCLS